MLASVYDFPVWKKDNVPALISCGKGFYRIIRSGKEGVVNGNLTFVIPCSFESVFSLDRNNLFKVRDSNGCYGLLDTNGDVVVPVSFEELECTRDRYKAISGGVETIFDKNGRIIL